MAPDQDRRPQGQAQPRQEERRIQGAPEPARPRQERHGQDRGRDPRGHGAGRRPAAAVHAAEPEVKKFADEVAALAKQIEEHAEAQKAQLAELDKAIVDAEALIEEDQRDRYRRTVKQRGADALAAVDGSACSGCYVTSPTR